MTGVQTCALPIWDAPADAPEEAEPEAEAPQVREAPRVEETQAEVVAEGPVAPPEPEEKPSQNGDGDPDWGYTPMSQWGLDDKDS